MCTGTNRSMKWDRENSEKDPFKHEKLIYNKVSTINKQERNLLFSTLCCKSGLTLWTENKIVLPPNITCKDMLQMDYTLKGKK